MKQLILASASPRRAELIKLLDYPVEIKVKSIDEIMDTTMSATENVMSLAKQKAEVIALDYPDAIVIGADTIVCLENQILDRKSVV